MEVSIVLPALNEEKSVGKKVTQIREVLSKEKISFEIIVVDNNSEDRTAAVAKKSGARVVYESIRGYGKAIRKGFSEAKGKYVITCDSDGTYDTNTLPLIIKKLREGYDYVNGNRFAELTDKSMSFSHRLGNKIINSLGNFFFDVKGKDMLSGYKGFNTKALKKIDLHAQKWELPIEIHSKIKICNIKFTEVPTRYFPRVGESKLSGTTATWHNLRFMLLYSPNFVFIYPSIILMLISLLALITITIIPSLGNISLLASSIVFMMGLQMFLFGLIAKHYLFKKGFEKKSLLNKLGSKLTLERGIIISLIFFTLGLTIFITLLIKWLNSKILTVADIKIGVMGLTSFMTSISIITYSFINQILNE